MMVAVSSQKGKAYVQLSVCGWRLDADADYHLLALRQSVCLSVPALRSASQSQLGNSLCVVRLTGV